MLTAGRGQRELIMLRRVQVVDFADVLRTAGRSTVVVPGVREHAAQHGSSGGVRPASQRRHHFTDTGDAHDVRDAAVDAAADRIGRRRESRRKGDLNYGC